MHVTVYIPSNNANVSASMVISPRSPYPSRRLALMPYRKGIAAPLNALDPENGWSRSLLPFLNTTGRSTDLSRFAQTTV